MEGPIARREVPRRGLVLNLVAWKDAPLGYPDRVPKGAGIWSGVVPGQLGSGGHDAHVEKSRIGLDRGAVGESVLVAQPSANEKLTLDFLLFDFKIIAFFC